MKKFIFIVGIILNMSLLISSFSLCINGGTLFMLLFLMQPMYVFYNHYKAENFRQLELFNGLLVLSNICGIASYKIYFEFVYKSIAHGLSWDSVMTEIGFEITFRLLIIIVVFVVLECLVSLIIKYGKYKGRY